MSRYIALLFPIAIVGAACADGYPPPDRSAREPALAARKQDIDHGTLRFEVPLPLTLRRKSTRHLVHFTLTASARVTLHTEGERSQDHKLDTVLTLYREGDKTPLARNDDDGVSGFSRLQRLLPTGSYVAAVEGLHAARYAEVVLVGRCTGQGCPAGEEACPFGDTFYELRSEPRVTIVEEHWIRSLDELAGLLEAEQLVIAVQQSSHTDVLTPAEALAVVDQNEIRHMTLHDATNARSYVVFEYGAGDNSYGAIFDANSLNIAAIIHDGDLLECRG